MLHLLVDPAPDRADCIFDDSRPHAALESVPLVQHSQETRQSVGYRVDRRTTNIGGTR